MKITARKNGPFLVEGPCRLVDEDGITYLPKHPGRFALCRCGASRSIPFCDGTHETNGYTSPPRAPGPPSSADLGGWEDEGGSVDPPPAPTQEDDNARAHLRMHRLIR